MNKKHIDDIEKQMKLANEGLPECERCLFSDDRPSSVEAFNKYYEGFLNWARSRSLWMLAFGTGCGATELRPLMTSRFDMARFGIFPRPTNI